ncbi:phage major tail tube protein [Mesorhizobium sp. ANAO-SY3R2]|uniref:phage major tail tube protein n=1 Tax=Mesorhizobium sp. ANAO-SY3R2 TaxID=3166644 RepID=UPI00367005F9
MSSPLYNLDAANMFVGDDDPGESLYTILKSVKFFGLEEATKDHLGGGAVTNIKLGMRAYTLSPIAFTLEGLAPNVQKRIMPVGAQRIKYTIRGNVRDIRSHDDIPLRCVVEGRMTKAEISEFERDKGVSSSYEINEMLFYHLHLGAEEKFYFDYWAGPNGLRIDGVPVLQGMARNLGLA